MEILLVLFGLRPDSGRDALKSGSTAPAFQRKFCPSCPLFPRFSLSCPVTIWVFEIPRSAGPRWWSGILCRAQGRARLPGCWQSFKELKGYKIPKRFQKILDTGFLIRYTLQGVLWECHMKRGKEKVTLKIPRPLYENLSEIIEGSGFNSVTEFVVYVLRDLISSRTTKGGPSLSKKEIEMV